MELLLVLLALALVTLVGHGIWLVLAALVRALFPGGARRPGPAPRVRRDEALCPACDARLGEWDEDCPRCGLDPGGARAGQLRELDAAARQVRDLLSRRELDQDTTRNLLGLFARRRSSLLGGEAKPAAAPPPPPRHVETVRVPPLPAFKGPAEPEEILDVLPAEPEMAPVELVAAPAEPAPRPAEAPTPTRAPGPSPKRGNVLSAFMEERNILWGELVGGLLIVGCSIALVLTLWHSLQAIPYFPFLLFTALTAALFGAGQYTLHHWKLQSTSRGLLLIALLLAPLNLLVLADPSARGPAPAGGVDFAVGALALLGFTLLVRASGRDLIGVGVLAGPIDRRWLLALAVVGAAGSQLLTPHLLDAPDAGLPARFLPLVALPAAFHLLACGAVLGGLSLYGMREKLQVKQAHALFAFLGLATFSVLSAFGFLLSRLAHPASGLPLMSCPLVLAGMPALAAGLLVYRKLEGEDAAAARTVGTAVGLAGLGVMLAGVALAWPVPAPLLAALLLAGISLGAAAFTAKVPWAWGGAVPCLSLAALVGFYLAGGRLPASEDPGGTLVRLLSGADSGLVLAGVMAALAILGGWLRGKGAADQARVLGWGALAVGGTALVIVTAHAPGRPLTAAAVHGACMLVGLAAGVGWRSSALTHLAGALLLPATLWALLGWYPGRLELWGLVLAAETLALVIGAVVLGEKRLAPLPAALGRVGLFTGALAVLLALVSGNFPRDPTHTVTALAFSLALLVQALHSRSEGWFTAFQAALIGAVLCLVSTIAWRRGWQLDERGVQAYGVGLALLSLLWVGARKAMVGWETLEGLLPTTWPGLDRLLLGALVVGQLLLAGAVALPGVASEWVAGSDSILPGHVFGPGAWLLLGVLSLALAAELAGPAREAGQRTRGLSILGLVLLAVGATTLWAGMHITDRATASALRWGMAGCFLAGSALVWIRQPLLRLAEKLHLASAPVSGEVRALLGAVAGVVVFLTAILTGLGFSGEKLPGPLAESVFAKMGPVLSSIGPLVLVIAGLVGASIRERSPGYALAAGLLATLSSMGGYALGVVQGGKALDDSQAVLTVLIGCSTAGVFALAWLAGRRGIGAGPLLAVQSWMGLVGLVVLAAILLPGLLSGPGVPAEGRFAVLGGPVGWLALAITASAAFWQTSAGSPRRCVHVAGLVALAAGVLGGSLARVYDTPAVWVSYHVLAGFWGLLALGLAAGGSLIPLRTRAWQVVLPARRVRRWLAGFALLLTIVSLVGGWWASARPTPVGAVLAACVLTGSAALWFRHGGFAHPSGLLFTLATFLAWVAWGPRTATAAVLSVVVGLALAAAFWQVVSLPGWRVDVAPLRWPGGPFSVGATIASLVLLVLVVGVAVGADALGETGVRTGVLGWAGLIAVGAALAAALGDPDSRLARPGLYVLGLALAGLVLHELRLSPARLAWAGALALAVHAGLAGLAMVGLRLEPSRAPSAALEPVPCTGENAIQVRVRLTPLDREWSWLLPAQAAVACVVVLLGFGVAVSQPALLERLAGPLAVGLLVPAALGMARLGPNEWTERLRTAAGGFAAAALAALAWAGPDPRGPAPWLERNSWLLLALTGCCLVGLEGLRSWPGGRKLGVVLGWMAVLLAPVVLAQMFPLFDKATRRTPLSGWAVLAVAFSLATLVGMSLKLAIQNERDPLGLSEGWRTSYVYLAEVLVVLLFLHIRLNVPELFLGMLARYWTLGVLLLAFLGVGLSELCERHQLRVLAAPLQRTGIFLPLIPILAFWARPPAALVSFADRNAPGLRPLLGYLEAMPWDFDAHALIWFLSAALYAVVAMARRSMGWAVAAALAANFGLWALLMHAGVGFLTHPQAWVIPLGLIVLASEYVNHQRLSREASQALRYLGISLIYVASTADLFLAGLGNSLWLPIILAVLCLAGVLAGMLLRVRAFLFLGVGFLLVDVLTMIWHAAVDRAQTWLWWACGIVLGAAILALFALFEKRRNDVLDLLDRFRRWD
jgi:hypothetical protein